jgi:protein-disulfide isomerase
MTEGVEFEEIHAGDDFKTFQEYGVISTPTIIVLNGAGQQTYVYSGAPEKDTLESEIKGAM